MKTTLKYLLGALIVSLFSTQAALAASWPASTSTSSFSYGLPTGYEVSGLAWNDASDYLYAVSDEGVLSRMSSDGSNVTNWPSTSTGDYNADFEGVTVTGTNNNVYVGNEDNNTIYEFTSSTSTTSTTLPTKKWSFLDPDWTTSQQMINADNNLGLEGIAYIPAGDWYDYEVFLGLQQSTGTIFVGRPDLNTSGNFTYVTQFTPVTGAGHPSDLFYSLPEKKLYVLYDDGYVRVLNSTNVTQYTEYTLTGSGQEEGFALQSDGYSTNVNAFIGIDNPSAINKYSGFPQTYPVTTVDADNDGYNSDIDCNDTDRAVYTYITYYRDADGDTYGSSTDTTSICTNVVPTGYVTNSSDANDADYDNDGVSYTSDCNDADSAVSSNRTYYRDADGDTLGDPNTTTSICDNNVPYGYVTNANDTDDTQAPVTEVIPSAPTNLLMERLALRKMRMTWNGSGDYYNVKLTDVTAGKTSTFTDITATTKTVGKNYIFSRHIYTFSVQACNDQGCSAYTNSSSFKAYSIKQWRRIQRLNRNR